MSRIPAALLAASLLLLPSMARSQEAPPGWRILERHGNAIVASPTSLERGETFVVEWQPDIDLRGLSMRDWFGRAIEEKSAGLGEKVKDRGIEARGDGSLASVRAYRKGGGPVLFAIFNIGELSGGRLIMASTLCSPESCRAYGGALKEWEKILEERSPKASAPPAAPAPADTPAYRTRPGRGIKPAEIEKVFGLSNLDSPVLVLKNGEYCTRLNLPPADMDVAAHKQRFPRSWGRWRRQGGRYQTLRSDGTWRNVGWTWVLSPARAGDELVGAYRSSSGTATAPGATISVSSNITFLPGRRFRTNDVSAVSVGGGGREGSAGATTQRRGEGSYRLDRSTIELRHDSGVVARHSFYWGDAAKKNTLFIDGTFYYSDDP